MTGEKTWLRAETACGALALDPAIGNIRQLEFVDGARRIVPLHSAPWLDEAGVQADDSLLPVERSLAGDFFCAPFSTSDVEPSPAHGWSANSPWRAVQAPAGSVGAVLERAVMGARIAKSLSLAEDAPLLYQQHEISGGEGGLPVAHHPMIRLAGAGRLFTSPKRVALTPDVPLEPGRAKLAYPAESADLAAFPGADGPIDLTRLPIADAHEDFVTLIEAESATLGWTAVLREAEGDIVFFLKDPALLPVTMLWHSNAGRDYAPWNGRHTGVLGIEDGCAPGAGGHAAALRPNAVSAHGVPTTLDLAPGRTHRIAHVIGAIARPEGWGAVTDIRIEDDRLILTGDAGSPRVLPFRAGFMSKET